MKVGALLLAAGLSRRMGAVKLTLPVDGVPMLVRSHAAIAGAGLPVLLVTGAHAARVGALLPHVPAVHAPGYAEGLSESLKAGLAAAPPDWEAALVVLGDMPFVRADTLGRLAGALAEGAGAVVPVNGGRRGNPVGIARRHWPVLGSLSGDQGARALLDGFGVVELAVDDPGIHRDLDRPEDLPGHAPGRASP